MKQGKRKIADKKISIKDAVKSLPNEASKTYFLKLWNEFGLQDLPDVDLSDYLARMYNQILFMKQQTNKTDIMNAKIVDALIDAGIISDDY